MKWIVINGNPIDGYKFYGTFSSELDASYWGSINFEESGFTVVELKKGE